MDPQCYFSTTPWRRAKQTIVNRLKQKARHTLLQDRPGKPIMAQEQFLKHFEGLINQLKTRTENIHVIGLPPVNALTFPGSGQAFSDLNDAIKKSATTLGFDFINTCAVFEQQAESEALFYLDGFHPSRAGAHLLAQVLHEHLAQFDAD